MEDKCRYRLTRLMCSFAFVSLVLFIIFCVLNLKPYLASKNYVNTTCVMDSKNQYAGEGECRCGRRCTAQETCGAGYVNIPSTGVKHVLLSLDETETSNECTETGGSCGFPYNVDNLPAEGAQFACLYNPDDTSRVIWRHQSKGFLLPALLVPAALFVIFTGIFCGMCWYNIKKSPSSSEGFSRLHNQAI